MNEIQSFQFHNHNVRTINIDGDPWFVGKDVADVLGYSNTRDALIEHVDMEDRMIAQKSDFPTLDIVSPRGMIIVNESGLYSLVLASRLPNAREFKHWVTSEVLPAIRKTGHYSLQQSDDNAVDTRKELVLPQTSAPIKAAEKIAAKVFKAESNEDFKAVLALDTVFTQTFGVSALEIMGLKISKRENITHGTSSWDLETRYWEESSEEFYLEQLSPRYALNTKRTCTKITRQ